MTKEGEVSFCKKEEKTCQRKGKYCGFKEGKREGRKPSKKEICAAMSGNKKKGFKDVSAKSKERAWYFWPKEWYSFSGSKMIILVSFKRRWERSFFDRYDLPLPDVPKINMLWLVREEERWKGSKKRKAFSKDANKIPWGSKIGLGRKG